MTKEPNKYEPDYENECCVCGATPIVTVTNKGKKLHSTEMCGPCTWGEADMIDPNEWNE